MKKFNHVIVRRPCRAMVEGITSGLYPGKPDYERALKSMMTISPLFQDAVLISPSFPRTRDILTPAS